MATARTQGKRAQHGKPLGVVGDDQPDAGDGQAGRLGVAERPVVLPKPGNAGGGKGPQFKTNAASSEGPGDWATYQLRRVFRSCRWRYTRKRRPKPATASTRCTTRSPVRRARYWTDGRLPAVPAGCGDRWRPAVLAWRADSSSKSFECYQCIILDWNRLSTDCHQVGSRCPELKKSWQFLPVSDP